MRGAARPHPVDDAAAHLQHAGACAGEENAARTHTSPPLCLSLPRSPSLVTVALIPPWPPLPRAARRRPRHQRDARLVQLGGAHRLGGGAPRPRPRVAAGARRRAAPAAGPPAPEAVLRAGGARAQGAARAGRPARRGARHAVGRAGEARHARGGEGQRVWDAGQPRRRLHAGAARFALFPLREAGPQRGGHGETARGGPQARERGPPGGHLLAAARRAVVPPAAAAAGHTGRGGRGRARGAAAPHGDDRPRHRTEARVRVARGGVARGWRRRRRRAGAGSPRRAISRPRSRGGRRARVADDGVPPAAAPRPRGGGGHVPGPGQGLLPQDRAAAARGKRCARPLHPRQPPSHTPPISDTHAPASCFSNAASPPSAPLSPPPQRWPAFADSLIADLECYAQAASAQFRAGIGIPPAGDGCAPRLGCAAAQRGVGGCFCREAGRKARRMGAENLSLPTLASRRVCTHSECVVERVTFLFTFLFVRGPPPSPPAFLPRPPSPPLLQLAGTSLSPVAPLSSPSLLQHAGQRLNSAQALRLWHCLVELPGAAPETETGIALFHRVRLSPPPFSLLRHVVPGGCAHPSPSP